MGGGGGTTQLSTFDAESKFALKKKKKKFAKNFQSFWAKKCLGIVLDFEYQVVRYTKYMRTTNRTRVKKTRAHTVHTSISMGKR